MMNQLFRPSMFFSGGFIDADMHRAHRRRKVLSVVKLAREGNRVLGDLGDYKLELVSVAPSQGTEVIGFGVAKRGRDGRTSVPSLPRDAGAREQGLESFVSHGEIMREKYDPRTVHFVKADSPFGSKGVCFFPSFHFISVASKHTINRVDFI